MAINSEHTKLLPSKLQTTKINFSLDTVTATLGHRAFMCCVQQFSYISSMLLSLIT